jgi:hypothetical protein
MPRTNSNLKTISPGGQISLGKKFAGQQVIVEQVKDGVWTITAAIVIPKNEEWLWKEPFKSQLDASLQATVARYANGFPADLISLEELEQKISTAKKELVENAR